MPNRKYAYADMEKFRKTTNAQKKRYYNKTKFHCSNVWTAEQDTMVLEHLITDTELSKIIQHSVKAIQVRRCRLKKKNKEVGYIYLESLSSDDKISDFLNKSLVSKNFIKYIKNNISK